ncbi:PTS system, sorbose-specific IIB component [Clostridium amylolyticum]|uniref:PTS system, sorbose-specific IIB component n=1 Tax=Clostridium amylolyticum TaxID=1121298 RepID=A0A1M6NH89_9CLOT|nr:PTS sugar transporter subunit IIB [Clostridium amylolyticum]SHJ94996.1 PTS system, sorbose-specific IIB component [Clostridium amylolyticum]
MITIARIDERLIHGQVAFAWSVQYPSDAILVIDNEVCKDNFQKSLLEMATPQGMRCFVKSQDDATEFLKKYQKKKIFVVVKSPKPLLHIVKNGVELKEINVGGLYHKEGREQISNTVFLDDELKDIFRELKYEGVKLEIRATPSDRSINLEEKL